MWFDGILLAASKQYEKKRLQLLKQVPKDCGLYPYLSVPLPELNSTLGSVPLVSVDFETTGLDAKKDKLLSIGCVDLSQRQIQLGSSFHQIIALDQSLDASNVTIHTITDNECQNGQPLKQVFEQFLAQIAGKVILVHFNKIEREFMQEACRQLYGVMPVFPMIDTMMLARKKFIQLGLPYEPQDLTLASLRKRAKLPFYQQHHALSDAIATAELYLTMVNLNTAGNTKLKDVLI